MTNFTMKHMGCASTSGNALLIAKTPVDVSVLNVNKVFSDSRRVSIFDFNPYAVSSGNIKVEMNGYR